jgi:predicted ArsR family transcriptional regulator
VSDNDQPEGADVRSSVLLVLSLAAEPIRCDQVTTLSHFDYQAVRRTLAALTRGGLVWWSQATDGRPETFVLTDAGRQTAELLKDSRLNAIERDVKDRVQHYRVPKKYQVLYAAIAIKYLTGVPMNNLVAEFGNYERIQAARRALRLPSRTYRSGNAHPSTEEDNRTWHPEQGS